MASEQPTVLVEYRGKTAIITLNAPKKLNALGANDYYQLACAMNEVASRDEVCITILTGKGRFFSAGADVSFGSQTDTSSMDEQHMYLRSFVANNLFVRPLFLGLYTYTPEN